jgi:hypothetical protein
MSLLSTVRSKLYLSNKVRLALNRVMYWCFSKLTVAGLGSLLSAIVVTPILYSQNALADGAVTCGEIVQNNGTPIVCAAPVQKLIEYQTFNSPLDVTVKSGTVVEQDDPTLLNKRVIDLYWLNGDTANNIRLLVERGASVVGGSATPGANESVYIRGGKDITFDNHGVITHATQNPVTNANVRHVAVLLRHDIDDASGDVVFNHHEGASIIGSGTTPSGILAQSSGLGSIPAQIDGSVVTSGTGGEISYGVDLRKFNFDNSLGAGTQFGRGNIFVGTGRNSLIDVTMASGTNFGIVAGNVAAGGYGATTIVHQGELNVRSGGNATGLIAYGSEDSNDDDSLVYITADGRVRWPLLRMPLEPFQVSRVAAQPLPL